MKRDWWNNFTGIRYAEGGASYRGCDCWGMVRLIYRDVFNTNLPGPDILPESDLLRNGLVLTTKEAFWNDVAPGEEKTGDVVLFNYAGRSHVGLVTTPGNFLHVREAGSAVVEHYDNHPWMNMLRGLYRYTGTDSLDLLAPAAGVRVIGCPHPLQHTRIDEVVEPGMTLGEIADYFCDKRGIPPELRKHGHAYVDTVYYPRERWNNVIPSPGQVVQFRIVPGSGGMRIFATIAVMAAAVAASTLTAGLPVFAAEGALAGLGSLFGGLAGGLVGILGSLLISALFPAATPKMPKGLDAPNEHHFLSGSQNRVRPDEPIMCVLGSLRVTADYLGLPYTRRVSQYVSALVAAYTFGYGRLEITDIRNGDTPLTRYQGMQLEVFQGLSTDPAPVLYTKDIKETTLNITLAKTDNNYVSDWFYFTTPDDTDQINLEFYWPEGNYGMSRKSGKFLEARSKISVQVRQLPSGDWKDIHRVIGAKSFTLQSCSPQLSVEQVYDSAGELEQDQWWLAPAPPQILADNGLVG